MLQEAFLQLLGNYTNNNALKEEFWIEISKSYSSRNRHYHTLPHLENVLTELKAIQHLIQDWDTIMFTLFYHDVVYNPLKSDNEIKSAILAQKRMKKLDVPNHIIERCQQQILATQSHQFSPDTDTNYFTDADLSVLGQSWETYFLYFNNVRKEYSIYPDFLYKSGRKKVLQYFLNRDTIFKTSHFYDTFEKQARENLLKEMEILG